MSAPTAPTHLLSELSNLGDLKDTKNLQDFDMSTATVAASTAPPPYSESLNPPSYTQNPHHPPPFPATHLTLIEDSAPAAPSNFTVFSPTNVPLYRITTTRVRCRIVQTISNAQTGQVLHTVSRKCRNYTFTSAAGEVVAELQVKAFRRATLTTNHGPLEMRYGHGMQNASFVDAQGGKVGGVVGEDAGVGKGCCDRRRKYTVETAGGVNVVVLMGCVAALDERVC